MQWIPNKQHKRFDSECKKYRLENAGKKGGEHYRILTLDPISKTWCKQLGQGTLEEMKEKEL
jgi:hypothetical protein